MKFLIDNIELVLSTAGLAVIWFVPELIAGGHDSWQVTALTATGVGVLHGVIFWIIRRRQRTIRNEAIAEIQLMLKDQINSQLTVITLSAEQAKEGVSRDERLRQVQETSVKISKMLSGISDESLRRWRGRYANLFDKP